MAYTDPKEYMKFQGNEGCGDKHHHSPCEGCPDQEQKCSCCPPGLVAVYDDKGNHLSCLTANDAEQFQKNTFTCQDGYVKLFRNQTGEFLGCVSEGEFTTMYNAVNPTA